MPEFVFLEISDRDLNYLFRGIHWILYRRAPDKATHLTIRGPYSGRVPSHTVDRCRKIMQHDVLTISGVGRFSNPSEEVVFLRVNSQNLRRVWWKPDYPIREHGFNPHISLYRGSDRSLAAKLETFFIHENLRLDCAEFKIATRVTRQLQIFDSRVPHALVQTGRVSSNLLDRLRVLVRRHQLLQGTD